MKAYIVPKGSRAVSELRCVERPDPVPGPGEILVRMRAASLNFRDQAIMTGNYFGGTAARDTIVLSDGAGEVIAVGAGVTRFRVGDHATGTFFQDWIDGPPPGPRPALGSPADGVLAELVVFDQDNAVVLPPALSFEEGATFTCAGVTAWNAVVLNCRVRLGETVLVLGSGGVSIFALQLARAAGARVLMVSSSDAKLERARALGADGLINYQRTPEWDKEIVKLTGGLGVNHVIEVGGPGTLMRSMRSIGMGGHIALIGVLAGFEGDTNPHPVMMKGGHMHGIFVGSRSMLEHLLSAVVVNNIKPVIDRVFGFDEALAAYQYQGSGAHFGKVVIRI